MSTTIFLMRHGDNDWIGHTLVGWTPGIHLNENGRRQAERLAHRLGTLPIAAVYSSPLERALETAAPLAARLGLGIRTCDGLGEIRLGEWTGRKVRDLEDDPLWRRFNRQRSTTRIPGGESMLEVQLRMVDVFEEIRTNHPDASVAVFSHGDPIRAILMHYLGTPLDFVHRLEVFPASISRIVLNDRGPLVVTVNEALEIGT
jgi:probable phosphomutase (TIGR03848 family)